MGSVAPQEIDLYFTKDVEVNMTFTFVDVVCDSVGKKTESNFNLTGYGAVLKVRPKASSPDIMLTISTSTYELSVSSNVVTWSSGANTFDGIEPGTYRYELFLYGDSVDDFVGCVGDITIAYKITR